MGGIEPAYTFVKRSLLAGKSVATSNKALVAKHGAELLSIAKEKNINFLFEASVGGGIPIIRPLNSSLTADEIEEITGILNGTTNYILPHPLPDCAPHNHSPAPLSEPCHNQLLHRTSFQHIICCRSDGGN